MQPRDTVGLIGVGLLGTALAKRLTNAGFDVKGYDPDPAAADRLGEVGGHSVSSPIQVAQDCSRILFSLPGPQQVAETVAVLENRLQPASIILDTTTGDPVAVEEAAARLKARQVHYLDCEVGGSSKQAAAGEAILLCGGDPGALAECTNLLQAISARVFYTGPAGTGTRMKLVLNLALGLHRAVLAESLEFARANGLDPALALDVLKAGPAYSKAMEVKGHKMLSGDFTAEARLRQHLKDVRLIVKTGAEVGAWLPLSRLHETLLSEAADQGYGEEDNSAVIRLFQRRTE